MKLDSLAGKEEVFWRKVSNAKTDQVIIFMILKEIRDCDILGESNQVKMTRLSKIKALTELLDIETIYKDTESIVDSDDELLEMMSDTD